MQEFAQRPGRRQTVGTILSFAILAILFAQTAEAQSRQERQLTARAESLSGDTFPVRTSTPRGVRIYAQKRPRTELLQAIDSGFTDLFALARKRGYQVRMDFASYTVFIAKADRISDSSGGYSPDIAVPAGQYAGSGYDQGGFVYAAGIVLAFNPSALMIAEHEKSIERVSSVMRFEGEHIILYYNDRSLYEKTKDHSRGGGHPILR